MISSALEFQNKLMTRVAEELERHRNTLENTRLGLEDIRRLQGFCDGMRAIEGFIIEITKKENRK